ncbi:PucR family transcriptional regulator [Amycolatopsis sp. NPDC057786]|uniref:PucR family transcriptional regulator n=1 Tax=Amycolatopsis sp. NPDC057786 TaxID=3346250 RepID=UPI00366C060C
MVGLAFPTTGDTLADRLIDGGEIEPDVFCGLAGQYVVAVLTLAGGRLDRPCCRGSFCSGVLLTGRDGVGIALVPDVDPATTRSAIRKLGSCLPAGGWLALSRRPADRIVDGYREALDIVRLLEAGRRPGGTYQMTDVLVEYAVTREQEVAEQLVSMIKPLRQYPVLRETLVALVDADHNRNQAAKLLFVHRSTIDYRLGKIAEITGVDPLTGRGLQQLAIALIAEAFCEPPSDRSFG